MWCRPCGQDVPGIASPRGEGFLCPRCLQTLGQGSRETSAPNGAKKDASVEPLDGWELDQQLKDIERALQATVDADSGQHAVRFDLPHLGPLRAHWQSIGLLADAPEQGRRRWGAGLVAWGTLLLGMTGLFCGTILIGMAIVADRADLWTVAIPITLAGQVVLLVGLALRLNRAFHEGRHTAAKLEGMHAHLGLLAGKIDRARLQTAESRECTD